MSLKIAKFLIKKREIEQINYRIEPSFTKIILRRKKEKIMRIKEKQKERKINKT